MDHGMANQNNGCFVSFERFLLSLLTNLVGDGVLLDCLFVCARGSS